MHAHGRPIAQNLVEHHLHFPLLVVQHAEGRHRTAAQTENSLQVLFRGKTQGPRPESRPQSLQIRRLVLGHDDQIVVALLVVAQKEVLHHRIGEGQCERVHRLHGEDRLVIDPIVDNPTTVQIRAHLFFSKCHGPAPFRRPASPIASAPSISLQHSIAKKSGVEDELGSAAHQAIAFRSAKTPALP